MSSSRRFVIGLAVATAFAAVLVVLFRIPPAPSSRPPFPPSVATPAFAGAKTAGPGFAAVTAPPATIAADFDTWLRDHGRGAQPPLATGVALARERRAWLKELIVSDPRAALARAVPGSVQASLPPEIRAELETPVDGFGVFDVRLTCFGGVETIDRTADVGGMRFHAYVFGRRTSIPGKDRLAIHGIAIDDALAIDERPYRIIEDTGRGGPLTVAVGDERHVFDSASALADWTERARAAEAAPDPGARLSGPATAAATVAWTHGEKTVLWVRAEFSDDPGLPATDAEIEASMAAVDRFYRDVSRGRCSMRTVILPVTVRVTQPKAAFVNNEARYTDIETQALALARSYDAANGATGRFHPDRVDRTIVVAKSVPAFGFLGIATVGRSGAYLNGTVASDVVAHELGHNHGLFHSHAWRPTGTSAIGPGTHDAYGDVFDDMGNTARVPEGHFNMKQKDNLLFLEAGNVATVTTDGIFRLYRHDHRDATGLLALKIGAGDYEFWLEHRRQAPRPDFPEVARLRSGLQLRWGRYPATLAGTGTYLLDLTPGSAGAMTDAPMVTGETFRDVTGGLTLTVLGTGGEESREWIDVQVAYGATNAGNRNPILAASVPYSVVPARTDLTFSASASDPDGDRTIVRWDFGDGQALQVGDTVTRKFLKGGPVSVVCSAIDGRGGLATKSFSLVVDDPFTAWTRRNSSSELFNAVIFDGRQFIAAGPAALMTSADGITWTRRTAMSGIYPWHLAVAGSTYVAAGFIPGNQSSGMLATSTDGVVWRARPQSFTMPELFGVAFGAGRFVAVGRSGAVVHSIDGTTWAAVTPLTSRDLRDIHFAAGRFVAAGDSGTLLTSTDGISWTNRTVATAATFTVVVQHRGTWIAGNGTNLWTSTDAETWSQLPADTARTGFGRPLSLGADGLLAPASNDTLFLSDTGTTWVSTPVAVPTTTGSLRAAAAGNGVVVIAATSGRLFQTSLRSPTASPPQVAAPPRSHFVPVGQDVTFSVGDAVPGTSYQWSRNGEALEGATQATLTLRNAQPADNGSYTAMLTNFSGTVTSPAATLSVDPNTTRIVNLSIRSRAGVGSDVFTLGFVVSPTIYTTSDASTSKALLTRGVGPGLATFGVTGTLSDPRIEFYDGTTRIGANDDWGTGTSSAATLSDTFRQVGAFDLVSGSKDAALLTTFPPKAYTVQVLGAGTASGSALAEIYDLDTSVTGLRLANVSARGAIAGTTDRLIGGFVLGGSGQRTMLIRAVGPGLAAFGVSGALSQPVIAVYQGEQVIASNSAWTTGGNVAAVRSAAARVGAFALNETGRDSALLVTLTAGAYTLQVSGEGSAAGIALLEVYEVP